jgi:cysteine synthase
VHCVGTAASSRGVATILKRYDSKVRIVVVEPAESSVLLGGQPGPHKIEGVGIAAIRVAERLGPGASVVTLMADSGLKYLNTDVYSSSTPRGGRPAG